MIDENKIVAKMVLAADIDRIADEFTRFCIGDRKQSIAGLRAMIRSRFQGDMKEINKNAEEYNKLFQEIAKNILIALKKSLPVQG